MICGRAAVRELSVSHLRFDAPSGQAVSGTFPHEIREPPALSDA